MASAGLETSWHVAQKYLLLWKRLYSIWCLALASANDARFWLPGLTKYCPDPASVYAELKGCLFTKNALRWEPGTVKVVAVDALPAQLSYLESGHVQALYAQDCYGWGYRSVEILLNKLVKGQDPESARIIDPLRRVTRESAGEFRKLWSAWMGNEE